MKRSKILCIWNMNIATAAITPILIPTNIPMSTPMTVLPIPTITATSMSMPTPIPIPMTICTSMATSTLTATSIMTTIIMIITTSNRTKQSNFLNAITCSFGFLELFQYTEVI